MKTTKTIILFFFLSFSLGFSIDFDLEEITLPYDNLDITDLSVTNKTIICRAENKIYRSEDDGVTWEIVFDAPKKINHFYTLNPHTMFVVGDSGMVYRTMDYGETWIDLSVRSDLNLVRIAAKDYTDCLVITGNRIIFYKDKFNSIWTTYDNNNNQTKLLSVVFSEDRYYFGGRSYVSGQHSHNGEVFTENKLEAFTFQENKVSKYLIEYFEKYIGDFLLLFNIQDKLLSSAQFNNTSCLTRSKSFSIVDKNRIGFNMDKEIIIKPFLMGQRINVFTKSSNVYSFNFELLDSNGTKIENNNFESTNINKEDFNDVTQSRDSLFYISSSKSRIYKVRLKQTISNIDEISETDLYNLVGNNLFFSPLIQESKVYNYLGMLIQNKQINQSVIELKTGVYLVTYKYQNQYYTKKILVGF